MRSVAECQRREVGAVWLELVRILEDGRIAVSSGEHDKDRLAGAYGDLADEVLRALANSSGSTVVLKRTRFMP